MKKLIRNQAGATMIEFAIAIGIVLTILIAMIDLSLYFNGYIVARETARQITQRAVVNTNFAIDTRAGVNPSQDDINTVEAARRRIIEDSFMVFNASHLDINDPDNSNRYRFSESSYDNIYNNDTFGNTRLEALVLRPGEQALHEIRRNGTTTTEQIIHPSCDPADLASSELCRTSVERPGRDAWTFMQRNFPFYAQVTTRVNTILFGSVDIFSESIAWKDLCLLYTSPSPRDRTRSRMPSSA